MWSHDTMSKLAQLHRDELLNLAERERVARQMAANTTRSIHLAIRALVWLGRQLIVTGERLRTYHKAAMTTAALRSTRRG